MTGVLTAEQVKAQHVLKSLGIKMKQLSQGGQGAPDIVRVTDDNLLASATFTFVDGRNAVAEIAVRLNEHTECLDRVPAVCVNGSTHTSSFRYDEVSDVAIAQFHGQPAKCIAEGRHELVLTTFPSDVISQAMASTS